MRGDGAAEQERPGGGWADACRAARLFAVDPGLGLVVRAPPGAALDRLAAALQQHLPAGTPWRRLPPGTAEARLIGGLDLAATLAVGRPVAARGLLADADGGVLVVVSAERINPLTAGLLCRSLDTGVVRVERDGLTIEAQARFGLVAIDDGRDSDEFMSPGLADRLAVRLDLSAIGHRDCGPVPSERDAVAAARQRLDRVDAPAEVVEALCAAAAALGIPGVRAPLLALRAARAAAAFEGRRAVSPDDVALAARLVLGPRATQAPAGRDEAPPEAPEPADGDAADSAPPQGGDGRDREPAEQGRLDDLAVEAARATLPADLLAALATGASVQRRAGPAGARRGGGMTPGRTGRPTGSRRGEPGRGSRLDVLATLRAAAPWQGMRGRAAGGRILIRRDDVRVRRHEERRRTTTIFAVDASGSAAVGRLAEAKGAVELLLAECYIRRDDVALVAFRGQAADLLLPPTRSLVRAKRELASLPGGGGTPLASGLAAALDLARRVQRDGRRPVLALLTDGRGNVARDGTADRARALADSLDVARLIAAAGVAAVVIDVSPRPGPAAARLAEALGATYVALPQADAGRIAGAVQAATEPSRLRA